MYISVFKRLLDIIISLLGIIILSPLLLVIAIAIKIDTKGPVLFKQKRIGIHRSTFLIWKFRTMRIDTPKELPTCMLENPDYWITRVGKLLRKTSLDELPQLFNIFVGKMSIVGPRAVLWNENELLSERQKVGANDVRPGLTGWAQINGRDVLDPITKATYDGYYVQHLSFGFDCKCFFMTIPYVFKMKGVVEGKLR